MVLSTASLLAIAADLPVTSGNPRWRDDELKLLETKLPFMTEEQVSQFLPGRTSAAVKIIRQRRGIAATTKAEGRLTAMQGSIKLGLNDTRQLIGWIKKDYVRGYRVGKRRPIWMVYIDSLKRFAVNPGNWVYFDISKVQDSEIKRLIAIQKERWGDEWLTTRQAANLLGLETKDILRYIVTLRRLPAVQVRDMSGRRSKGQKWAYWFVKRSDVLSLRFRRSGDDMSDWTERADEFLVLAVAVGLSFQNIGKLMGCNGETARLRLDRLAVAKIVRKQRSKHLVMRRGQPHADWHKFKSRFPALRRAVEHYKSGSASTNELYMISFMLAAQGRANGMHLAPCGRMSPNFIKRMVRQLKEKGIRPYL